MREIRVASIQPIGEAGVDLPRARGGRDRDLEHQEIEEHLDMACRLLARAGESGCDITVYPEDIQGIAGYLYYPELDTFTDHVESIPGPTSDRISEAAKKHNMHVVFSMYERTDEGIYNTAVLLGRKGEIIGKYHKVQLPATERWAGVVHGDSFPVFEADFGTVGMMICYDMSFPEVARCLALNGAELLCHSTDGYSLPSQREGNGLMRVRMRAVDNFVPIAVAAWMKDAVIVSSEGVVLAMGRPGKEDVVVTTVDLEAMPADHSEWELITGLADLKARVLQERHPGICTPLTDPSPPALRRYRKKPLRPVPEQRKEAIEGIYRWWEERG